MSDAPTTDTAAEAAPATTEPETEETPTDPKGEALAAELTELLGDALVESAVKPNEGVWVRVDAARWHQCAQQLRDAGFTYFGFLSAIDWSDAPEGRYEDAELDEAQASTAAELDEAQASTAASSAIPSEADSVAGGDSRFQMLMHLHSAKHLAGVIVKADLPDNSTDTPPSIQSICDIFSGANWHEREAHEMFGIRFEGHPNLQPIYLPTEFEGHPLRKDFPLLARQVKPWPGIVDIEEIPERLQEQLEAEVMAAFEAEQAAAAE